VAVFGPGVFYCVFVLFLLLIFSFFVSSLFSRVSALPSPPRWLLGRGEHVAAREAASFVFPNSAAEGDRVLAEAAASVRDKVDTTNPRL
jgi:hypothetical protein